MTAESRRNFVAKLGNASVTAVCLGAVPWLTACASVPYAAAARTPGRLSVPISAFGDGSGVLVEFPEEGMPIYVHRQAEDRFTAVLTRCSHRGCEAEPNGERIVCPCHGSEYTPDGRVLQGPARRDLTRFPTTVEAGSVVIALEGGR